MCVSEKVVRRLMKEECIPVYYARRKRRFNSYQGEVSPAPPNLVQRNFHASEPNRLWLTDISEFAAPDAKVYLSPMIDCYDGKIVAAQRSRTPNKDLTQSMLTQALSTLPVKSKDRGPLLIHTDRGGHYRGLQWLTALESNGVTASMSRKGKTGDNAACEGFFGRMKTEMFYGRSWANATELENAIDNYLHWYNNDRIKTTLGGLTINEYREQQTKPSNKQS